MMQQYRQPIRVMLVDDHAVVRSGLRLIIDNSASMCVVAEAANSSDALDQAARESIDVILLDLDLGGESGLDLLPTLRSTAKGAQVIVLTGIRDREVHQSAVLLGAMGLVLKEHAIENLLKAIERVHSGEAWLDNSMVSRLLREMARQKEVPLQDSPAARVAQITQREWDVIALICEGLSNRAISERLSISETTVRHHLSSVFDKLDVGSRLELVIFAYRHSLVKIPVAA